MKTKTFARTTIVGATLLTVAACDSGSNAGSVFMDTDDSGINDIVLGDSSTDSNSTPITPSTVTGGAANPTVSDVADATPPVSSPAVTTPPVTISTPIANNPPADVPAPVVVINSPPAEVPAPVVVTDSAPAEVATPVVVVDTPPVAVTPPAVDTPPVAVTPPPVVDTPPPVAVTPPVVDTPPVDVTPPPVVVETPPTEVAEPVAVTDETPAELVLPMPETDEAVVDTTPGEVAESDTASVETPAEPVLPISAVEQTPAEITMPVADADETPAEITVPVADAEETPTDVSDPVAVIDEVPAEIVESATPVDASPVEDSDTADDSSSAETDASATVDASDSDTETTPAAEEIVASDTADTTATPPPALVIPTGITASTILPATHGPIASVPFDFTDPFGTEVEANSSVPSGTIPQAPGNLRLNLLSNNWIELDWTPSVDDGEIVEYRIYRDGEQVYAIRGDQTHPMAGSAREARKYWDTTSFIDCNQTRFGGAADPLFNCAENAPVSGEEYVWEVTAVDDDGNESEPSNSLTARLYDLDGGSPVALYSDIYLDGDDLFPFATNFARTENFLDQFALVFADEFNGTSVDLNNWNTELVWTSDTIINGEQQYFVNSSAEEDIEFDPFRFTGSSVVIEAIPTPPEAVEFLPEACFVLESNPRCQFLSGALATHEKFGLTYGYVEGRIKVSGTDGALSSFYLFHRYPGEGNQFHSPEIDIVEYLGENPFGDEDAFQTYHYSDPVTGILKSSPTMSYKNPTGALFSDDFHTYSVLWEPSLVVWYIDGQEIRRITGPQVGRQQMNIVAYLVAGSEWAPTPTGNFPLQMEIDYIRAYQRAPYVCNNPNTLAAFDGDMAACQVAFDN